MTHCRFCQFTFQTANGELAGSDQIQNLRPKTVSLLSYLIAHRGRVIGKDELFHQVWNDSVVSDATLVQSIQELRKALDDSARAPRFIRTYPRRGYQWVSRVEEIEPESAPVSTPQSGKGRLLITLFVVAIAAVWVVNGWFLSPPAEPEPEQGVAANTIKVLVPPFHNSSGRKDLQWLELGLRDLMVSALDKTISMEEVSQVAYFRAALERGPERPEPEMLAAMLPKLGAQYAIHGHLVTKNEDVFFLFQVTGPEGSVLVQTVSYADLLENLPDIVVKIVEKFHLQGAMGKYGEKRALDLKSIFHYLVRRGLPPQGMLRLSTHRALPSGSWRRQGFYSITTALPKTNFWKPRGSWKVTYPKCENLAVELATWRVSGYHLSCLNAGKHQEWL